MSDKSVLSDEQLVVTCYGAIRAAGSTPAENENDMLRLIAEQDPVALAVAAGLRAVAEAAIAAERAARADREGQEPVAWIEFDGASVAYSPHKDAARRLPVGVRFDLYTAPPADPVVPEVKALECPKCYAFWLLWPKEITGDDTDALSLRSTRCCEHCESNGVEALQPLGTSRRGGTSAMLAAAPSGEQVGLTDAEMVNAYESEQQGRWGDHIRSLQAVIAAHEAKRVSCSQIAKKSTCDGGCVDETGKSEHVGGAA